MNAWVVVDRDGAMKQARAADAALASGREPSFLTGVPIGVKDIIDVLGLPTAAGSVLWRDRKAQHDAPVVSLLRSAGAIILGKTVCTPYAWIDPPRTTNPRNPARTPGGSSSGSAAAVACGMCLGALGSQTGGSITRPAAFCGISGMKPTYGRLSTEGVVPLAPSLDHLGPMAQTARDISLLWRALRPRESLVGPSSTAPRIGRLVGHQLDASTSEATESLDLFCEAARLSSATISSASLPDSFEGTTANHRLMMAVEAAVIHSDRLSQHPEDYPPRISQLIREGESTLASDYVLARQHQTRLKNDILSIFTGVEVLVMPAAPGMAPDRSTTGDPIFNSPWSYTGLPTITIPIGLSEVGLPLGVQLIGPPNEEGSLLAAAQWCELALHFYWNRPQ